MTIDRIPLPPPATGSLFLCARADAAPDPGAALKNAGGASLMVCLNELHELTANYLDYVDWLRANEGERALWHPTRDWDAHGLAAALPAIRIIVERLRAGDSVLVHCALGQGRAGTMAVCVLMMLGDDRQQALRSVADHRRHAGPASGAQVALVDALDDHLADERTALDSGIMES